MIHIFPWQTPKIHIFPAMTSVEVGEVGRAEPAVVRPESHLHFRIALASLWKGGCGEVLGVGEMVERW